MQQGICSCFYNFSCPYMCPYVRDLLTIRMAVLQQNSGLPYSTYELECDYTPEYLGCMKRWHDSEFCGNLYKKCSNSWQFATCDSNCCYLKCMGRFNDEYKCKAECLYPHLYSDDDGPYSCYKKCLEEYPGYNDYCAKKCTES